MFAGDLTYIMPNEGLNALVSDSHIISNMIKDTYAEVGLMISESKTCNFPINPFCLGSSLSILRRCQSGNRIRTNQQAPEDIVLDKKWGGPEGSRFRAI